MFVSRDADGTLNRVPVPLHYAYIFVAAAVIGMFTITGLAGSYSRMLIKTARFNQLRTEHNSLQKDYVHLEKSAHERDIQAASLSALATEVSALYGFTASKLTTPLGHVADTVTEHSSRHSKAKSAVEVATATPLASEPASFSDDRYYKSLDAFYNLRTTAMNGDAARFLPGQAPALANGLHRLSNSLGISDANSLEAAVNAPSLWPIMGPVTSGFGQREDPVLGTGEGEFHKGIDISAPQGTPIRATADGLVLSAGLSNGYGREVVIDHGHGLKTLYGHMSGFNVLAGQTVFRGEIIGYVGHSGRTTGNHVHYEVRIRDTAVNPHKYLRTTVADLGGPTSVGN
jgi:murein DD-endopeptidase MepM/ murein hydrolase activator NlpD